MAEAIRMEELCASAGLDGLLTASAQMARYLTGTHNPVRTLIVERPLLVLWPASGEPVLIAPSIESALLESSSKIRLIRYYSGRSEIVDALASATAGAGLTGSRIGTELAAMSADLFKEIIERLPSVVFSDESEGINAVRAVKAEAEVRSLEAAAQATRRAQMQALQAFEMDWTESRLARVLRGGLIEGGAETVSFLTLGSSGRNANAHSIPADQTLSSGDLLRMDFGGVFDGWHSDLAFTAAVKSPEPRQLQVYSVLAQILGLLITRLRPGLSVAEAYASVQDDFNAAGLKLNAPHVGHGIGLSVHEFPLLGAESEATVEAGMVLCAELVHVDGQKDRYHLEETIWVGPEGTRILSNIGELGRQLPIIGAVQPAI